MAQMAIELKGTSAQSSDTMTGRRYRIQFQTNFQPSFFFCFNQPFAETDTDIDPTDLDDFDTSEGYFPIKITDNGNDTWTVQMHTVGSAVSINQRYGSGSSNYFINFMAEQASLDNLWQTGDTLADVIAAYPNIMGDGDGDHRPENEDGEEIEVDDSGGPPPQCEGMCVYTDADWNFLMDSVDGRGGLMGVQASGQIGGSATFRMFVPLQLAIWMGLDPSETPALMDENREVRTDSGASTTRIGAYVAGTDYSTDYQRGFVFKVPVTFVAARSAFGAARATGSESFLVGSTGTPCFHGTTPITLLTGAQIRAEELREGHMVRCSDNVIRRVSFVQKSKASRAILFRRGALGLNLPSKRVIVTENHLICLPNGIVLRADEAMQYAVPNLVRWYTEDASMDVYHIGLEDWTWITVNGLGAETLAWKDEHHQVRPNRAGIIRRQEEAERLGIAVPANTVALMV